MSGQYDPTNLRDDRPPLRALGMAFGQREAMDQQDQSMMPQYQPAPLAAQLMARPNPLMGQPQADSANPAYGALSSGLNDALRQMRQGQQGGGMTGLYDWLRPAQQEMAMPAMSMPKGEW